MIDPIADARRRAEAFTAWLDELRAADATFAHASVLESAGWGEWQAACYLATGCHQVWSTVGERVIARRSFGAVVREHEQPSRYWSDSEEAILAWTAHLWRSNDGRQVAMPWSLDHWYRERWLTALRLRLRQAPTALAPAA